MNPRQLTGLMLLGMLAGVAHAEPNPYYLGASVGLSHDSNLLRLGNAEAAPAALQKADTITTLSLLAGLDQPIGRQRVFGNVTAGHNSLKNNPIFNNDSYTLGAGVDWQTAERISGTLRYNANRNLAQFNSGQLGLVATQTNIQSTRQFDATAKLGANTEFSFDAGAGYRSVDYSAAAYASRAFRQDSLSLGMHYRPSAVSQFGVSVRSANGRYPRFFDNVDGTFDADRFTRRDIDFTASYQPSGLSTLTARVSPSRIRYDIASARDFSGITGLLQWDWQAAGKLRVSSTLTRDPSQDSYFTLTQFGPATVEYSRITNSANVRAVYELSAKISLNATLGWNRRTVVQQVNTFGAPAVAGNSGNEHNTTLLLGAVWVPTRSLQFGCSLSTLSRGGTPPLSGDLRDTTTTCYAQGTIQ